MKPRKAIYNTQVAKSFAFRLEKRRGNGFTLSCFGGHHINKASMAWDAPNGVFLESDIDGCTDLNIGLNWWDAGYDKKIAEIKESLSEVFGITEWIEVSLEILHDPTLLGFDAVEEKNDE